MSFSGFAGYMGFSGYSFRKNYVVVNACLTEGTDGTKYGFLKGVFGTMNPPTTIDGADVFELSWQSSGLFMMSFGVAGDTQLTNVQDVYLTTANNYTVTLHWDAVATAYTGTDVGASQTLIADYALGKQRCALIEISMPQGWIISYDFSSIQRI